MLKRLMEKVEELESDANRADGAHGSSFDPYPEPQSKPNVGRSATEPTNRSKNNGQQKKNTFSDELRNSLKPKYSGYLPCHYFDYIGGTSAGG